MAIRSKHGNLLNYFIHDRRDLSPAYVRECEKFLKKIKKKKEPKRASAQAPGRVGPIVPKQRKILTAPGLWDKMGYVYTSFYAQWTLQDLQDREGIS